MLLLNAHTPCDDVNNDNEFKDILAEMQSHMVNHDNVDFVAFGGDLNTDISRDRSLHTVKFFLGIESLIKIEEPPAALSPLPPILW